VLFLIRFVVDVVGKRGTSQSTKNGNPQDKNNKLKIKVMYNQQKQLETVNPHYPAETTELRHEAAVLLGRPGGIHQPFKPRPQAIPTTAVAGESSRGVYSQMRMNE